MNLAANIDRLLSRRVRSGAARGLRLVRDRRCSGVIDGKYERAVQDVLTDNLRRGDGFLDVGANIGFFTLLAARLVGTRGSIHAFEPIPANADLMRRNLRINGFRNVTVVQKAVTDAVGLASIWLTDHPGGATLTSVGTVPNDAVTQAQVQTTSLDKWLPESRATGIRLIKIDVEGAELAALHGMRNLVMEFRPVLLVELDDLSRQMLNSKAEAVIDWLGSLGYSTRRLPGAYAYGDYQVLHLLANTT
jgi:FkbM family methyltransferase